VRVTWTEKESSENGAYGLYPVRSSHVLVEECEAFNSADAGIYVGQVSHTIVRNNLASGNVAGIEIENTQYADVYGNIAENNTGGLLIFDMPGNPIVTRDVWIHDNIVRDNNTPNFAPSGTVAAIPAGTGTVILAARRVVLTDNTYENNNTTDIAVINGLAIEGNTDSWAIAAEDIEGDWEDLNLTTDGTSYYNFRPNEILIANNTHSGSGSDPDINDYKDRAIGFVVGVAYGDEKVDDVLYDGIGESSFNATDPDGNSNDNHICVGNNTSGTYATLDLETLAARMETFDFPDISDLFRPEAPFAPFDCTELTGGDIAEVTVEAP
jgi:parallel beta-helix repeat protein